MINIKFNGYWDNSTNITNAYNICTPNGDGIYKSIRFNNLDYDFTIVQGSCDLQDLNFQKSIVIQGEPEYYRFKNYDPFFNCKDNYDKFYLFYDIENNHSINDWLIDSTYTDIVDLDLTQKCDEMFCMFSDKTETEYQKNRLFFLKNYLCNFEFFDAYYTKNYNSIFKNIEYGRTYETDSIFNVYKKYKYIFQSENSNENNYFTEKIIRSILCGCLTFYYGCNNLEKFIHSDCYIRLDLSNPEESLETIYKSIYDKEWEKRIDTILKQRELLMTKNNPLNIIESLIINKKFDWVII